MSPVGPVTATVRPIGAHSTRGRSAGRGDPVCVEDRVDVSQAVDALLQLLGVGHLDDEAILDHRVPGHATGLEDVYPGLGEGPREVLQQAGAIVGIDLQLDPVRGLVLAVPADVDEALRRLAQGLYVLAV